MRQKARDSESQITGLWLLIATGQSDYQPSFVQFPEPQFPQEDTGGHTTDYGAGEDTELRKLNFLGRSVSVPAPTPGRRDSCRPLYKHP